MQEGDDEMEDILAVQSAAGTFVPCVPRASKRAGGATADLGTDKVPGRLFFLQDGGKRSKCKILDLQSRELLSLLT